MDDRQEILAFGDWRQKAFDRFAFVLTRVPGVEAAWVSGPAERTPAKNAVVRLGCVMRDDEHPYRDAGSFWYQGLTVRLHFCGIETLRQRLFRLRPDWDRVAGRVSGWRVVFDNRGRLDDLLDEVRAYPAPLRLVCATRHISRFILSLESLDTVDSGEVVTDAMASAAKATLAAFGVGLGAREKWIGAFEQLAESTRLKSEWSEVAEQASLIASSLGSGQPGKSRDRSAIMEALAGLHIALLEWTRARLREYCGDRFTLNDCLLSRPELGVVQVQLENILQRLCQRTHTLSPEAIPELGFRMPRVEYHLDVPEE